MMVNNVPILTLVLGVLIIILLLLIIRQKDKQIYYLENQLKLAKLEAELYKQGGDQ